MPPRCKVTRCCVTEPAVARLDTPEASKLALRGFLPTELLAEAHRRASRTLTLRPPAITLQVKVTAITMIFRALILAAAVGSSAAVSVTFIEEQG